MGPRCPAAAPPARGGAGSQQRAAARHRQSGAAWQLCGAARPDPGTRPPGAGCPPAQRRRPSVGGQRPAPSPGDGTSRAHGGPEQLLQPTFWSESCERSACVSSWTWLTASSRSPSPSRWASSEPRICSNCSREGSCWPCTGGAPRAEPPVHSVRAGHPCCPARPIPAPLQTLPCLRDGDRGGQSPGSPFPAPSPCRSC